MGSQDVELGLRRSRRVWSEEHMPVPQQWQHGCSRNSNVAPVAVPPALLPSPSLTAWLQHTAVTRIHLCHHPTVGLMSSPVKPLEHSTWASLTSPRPPPRASGLASGSPSPSLNLHRVGEPDRCQGFHFLAITWSCQAYPDNLPKAAHGHRPGQSRPQEASTQPE